jgi:hypothetical protein
MSGGLTALQRLRQDARKRLRHRQLGYRVGKSHRNPSVAPANHSRFFLPFLVVVLGLLLLAPQASAADTFHFSGRSAFASWSLNDSRNTSVVIQAFDGKFQAPPGRPEPNRSAFVLVEQSFCDPASNELVFPTFAADIFGASIQSLSVDRQLRSAAVAGSASLSGFEFRVPNCANPDFDNETFTDLGEFPVQFSAQWTGSGPLTRSAQSFREKLGPQCKFSERSHVTERNATATGSITGALSLGNLGASQFADIFSTKDMSLSIDRGCPGP